MNTILFIKAAPLVPRPLGLVTVDMDINAERLMIIDRNTGEVINNTIRSSTSVVKLLVAISYTTSNRLLVGILDDSLVYDCKFVDGVMAEIVDANTVNMSQ
ncbi:hypothetical protein [Shewanella scandinavica]|uniref:Uncharacterized protein n=1 Tax=Shewanella scandinavica TaxID=3063538 RepID=A0ABU3G476_9GAMM|nr:hypothetical protein [Shewanella sp. SP2S1-2]MDT3281684.1 hypothetical protein [Shewanella sp. SP2S1-2]